MLIQNSGWHTRNGFAGRNILQDDRIGTNTDVVMQGDVTQNLSAGANRDIRAESGWYGSVADTECHLLENDAVRSNGAIRMNDNAIGVRYEKAATDLAAERNVGASDNAPETVTDDIDLAEQKSSQRVG